MKSLRCKNSENEPRTGIKPLFAITRLFALIIKKNTNAMKLKNQLNRNFFIAAICYCLFNTTVYAQWLDAYIPDFKVNDDLGVSSQVNSQIAVDSAGNFLIVWNDGRNYIQTGFYDLYCQRYDKNGTAIGSNFRIVSQDSFGLSGITMQKNGRFVLALVNVFINNSNQYYSIYYQRFDKNANQYENPVRIIDTSYSTSFPVSHQGMSISSDSLGNFVICWAKAHTFNSKIQVFFQRFDSSGVKLGGIDSVSQANAHCYSPKIAMNNDGSFVITWDDERNPQTLPDVYMQRFNPSGQKIGNNVKVSDDNSTGVRQAGNVVSTDGYGRIAVCWIDDRDNQNSIYYQLYDNSGSPIGVNRKANILSSLFSRTSPRVSMRNDGKFFIGWLDVGFTGREQVYGRRFDTSGDPIGTPYMIPLTSIAPIEQRINSLKLQGDRVFTTWSEYPGSGSNTDIWCNVRGFQNPDTVIGITQQAEIAGDFELFPVYPNPFNPETNIKYRVSKNNSFIKITIFDITGREIKTLINRKHNAGLFEFRWNAGNLSSGIYFLTIITSTGFTDTKKINLIK